MAVQVTWDACTCGIPEVKTGIKTVRLERTSEYLLGHYDEIHELMAFLTAQLFQLGYFAIRHHK